MEELSLTDNAVRAQLASLQLAGLIWQVGLEVINATGYVDARTCG